MKMNLVHADNILYQISANRTKTGPISVTFVFHCTYCFAQIFKCFDKRAASGKMSGRMQSKKRIVKIRIFGTNDSILLADRHSLDDNLNQIQVLSIWLC